MGRGLRLRSVSPVPLQDSHDLGCGEVMVHLPAMQGKWGSSCQSDRKVPAMIENL